LPPHWRQFSHAVSEQRHPSGFSNVDEMTQMKPLTISAVALAFLGAAPALAESTQISPNGSRPSTKGAPQDFTGSVTVDPLYAANANTSSLGGLVTFEPGARTTWHTHPAGQVLIIMSGMGWVQEDGGPKREVKPGDVVWFPPGVKHWHGASSTTSMSHIAITNLIDGKNVDWMEHVSDEQYRN
jgi:quercetin dioxygenase-like cupin family protein